ncbi:MAG: hypothetical protein ACLQBA_09265 [Candidatus Binataceae bacterium]
MRTLSLWQKRAAMPFSWLLVSALFVMSPSSVRCAAETAPVDWPLNDAGTEWTQLEVPIGYGNIGTKTVWSTPRKEAIQRAQKETGIAAQRLKLWASWPSMEIPIAKTPEEFYLGTGGNTMFLSLQSGQGELQFLARMDIRLAGTVCKRPDHAKSRSDLICHEGYSLVQKPPEFELEHRGLEEANDSTIYRAGFFHDIYYAPVLGDGLVTFIQCSDEEVHPFEHESSPTNANCVQMFIVPSLNATAVVSYSSEHLKDWRSIQQAWITKLQSFTVHL